MITVVGMWEPGYSLEQTFLEDTVWKQTLNAFSVDRFCMVKYPGVTAGEISSPEEYDTMEEALASTNGERIFMCFAQTGTNLKDFVHPADAVYIFGRPGDDMVQYMNPEDHKIHIQTPNNVDMLACSCVAAVLYDRGLA
jgi:tRNA(Leu) C34 or U34 (ribose-2'-O)-methylase TrmL